MATVADAASAAQGAGRRFVAVQVCGLSHDALVEALGRGDVPALGRLLARGRFRLHRIPGSLPTSTPAYQVAVMYGGPVDVPAFEFVEKATGTYRWFPRPWDAAAVEARHAEGRRGILAGGRTYGAVFAGGAEDTVLTFARLLRPEPYRGRPGVRARLSAGLAVGGMALRMSALTVREVARWLRAVARSLARGRPLPSPLPPLRRVAISGWLRELFTLGVIRDLRAGVPALYVNFVDYDVQAHAFGPKHPATRRALSAVDASIGRIASVVDQVPGLRYDLYVVSDHGQLPSVPFESVSGGASVVDVVADLFGPDRLEPLTVEAAAPVSAAPLRMPFWPFARTWQKSLASLEHRIRERNAVWIGGLCIVPAGPNVNVYLTHTPGRVLAEDIEARYPGALGRLAAHRGIGHVLVRDRLGAVCYDRNGVHRISSAPSRPGCLLLDRPDRAAVVRGLEDLLAMPSGGDLILLGHDTEAGCVSYLGEPGSHAGPSPEEMYLFVVAPAGVAFDFGGVLRPRDLYGCFAEYAGQGSLA